MPSLHSIQLPSDVPIMPPTSFIAVSRQLYLRFITLYPQCFHQLRYSLSSFLSPAASNLATPSCPYNASDKLHRGPSPCFHEASSGLSSPMFAPGSSQSLVFTCLLSSQSLTNVSIFSSPSQSLAIVFTRFVPQLSHTLTHLTTPGYRHHAPNKLHRGLSPMFSLHCRPRVRSVIPTICQDGRAIEKIHIL